METDETLAKKVQQGNDDAYQELTGRYLGPIYNFLLRLTRNPQNAEDIAQETFIKAWRHIKKFDPEQRFKTWIFTIARRTALDLFKKRKSFVFSDFENEEGENVILETLRDPTPPPLSQAEFQELRKNFTDELERMPNRYREILLLRYTQDLTFEEIASLVEKPLNTVKSLYRRGLIYMKKALNRTEK